MYSQAGLEQRHEHVSAWLCFHLRFQLVWQWMYARPAGDWICSVSNNIILCTLSLSLSVCVCTAQRFKLCLMREPSLATRSHPSISVQLLSLSGGAMCLCTHTHTHIHIVNRSNKSHSKVMVYLSSMIAHAKKNSCHTTMMHY